MSAEHEVYMAFAREILRRSMAEEDVGDLHHWMAEQMLRIGGAGDDKDGLMFWEDTFDFYDALLNRRALDAMIPPDERKSLLWPWASWNRLIDPLPPGMLAVITAGDGQGKTIVAECISESWALQRNRVVYVHYELNHSVMMDRRYSRHTGLTVRELKSGTLTPEGMQAINRAHGKLKIIQGGITYQHSAGWTMERTIARLRQLKADNLCDVVVVDYLEKNAASRRQMQMFGTSTFQREADNVEQIKNFAEQTETPVVLLAQLSKAGKKGDFDDLDRTAMRGAGEKSEKANVVILLHRDKEDGGYSNLLNVKVDKNTLGATGSFAQYMKPENFTVLELEEKYIPLDY
jgi:replicative DNA helicase